MKKGLKWLFFIISKIKLHRNTHDLLTIYSPEVSDNQRFAAITHYPGSPVHTYTNYNYYYYNFISLWFAK